MNRKTVLFGIVGLIAVVSAAYTANIQYGDLDLEVNGSPVLTAATNGGLTGEIVSASAKVLSTQTGVVYTTPATGQFVLTQICVNDSAGAGLIQGSSVGFMARHFRNGTCTEYFPGITLPQNEELTIFDDSSVPGGTVVTIIGVYQAP